MSEEKKLCQMLVRGDSPMQVVERLMGVIWSDVENHAKDYNYEVPYDLEVRFQFGRSPTGEFFANAFWKR